MTDVKAPPPPKAARDIYFVSPIVDVLIAGGGLSILFFFVCIALGYGPGGKLQYERPNWATAAAGALAFVVNYPHFAATNFRLYQSFDRMMQFPKTSFLSPIVVVAGLAWALVDPPFASWYTKIFLTWSSYHFCAQTKGIALLYARRLGVQIDPVARWLLVFATHAPWLFGMINTETYSEVAPFYGIPFPRGIPWWSAGKFAPITLPLQYASGVQTAALVIFWMGCGAGLALVLRTFVFERRLFPIAALMPILAQALWFGPLGSNSRAFNEFVPFFHSLQYMIIAWLFQLKEESARGDFVPNVEMVVYETLKWLALVIAGGIALFILWPHGIAWRGYALDHSLGCVNAAIQIHHFFVDGVIWKIRDPRTRAMLGGNIFDLAGFERIRTILPA